MAEIPRIKSQIHNGICRFGIWDLRQKIYAVGVLPVPIFFVALLGAVMGSFGNVVVLRGIAGESLGGRSRCPHCRHMLGVMDLVPILSFLLLRGRCRFCRASISAQYPLIELGSAVLFALAYSHEAFQLLPGSFLAISLWLLLLIAVYDGRTGLIPDALSLPLLVAGIAYALVTGNQPWIAMLVCGGFFGVQWVISRGTWVGSGDIILAAGLGALVRMPLHAFLVLLLAYSSGAIVAVGMLLSRRKTTKSTLAFGPFLALAGIVAALWGDVLLRMLLWV